jgi:hypothetical protein
MQHGDVATEVTVDNEEVRCKPGRTPCPSGRVAVIVDR